MGTDSHPPDRWYLFLDQAKQKIKSGDYASALSSLNKAILSVPQAELAECYGLRGFIQLNLHEYEKAESDCSAAMELNPTGDELFIWRGSARAGQRRWRDSINDLTHAVELNQSNFSQCDKLIRYSAESSIEEIRKIAMSGQLRPQHWFERAFAYRCLGMQEKALRDVNLAVRAEGDDTQFRLLRGELMLEMDQLEKAVADFTEVVDNDRARRVTALRMRAKAYVAAGRISDAFQDLDRVKALRPGNIANLMECGSVRFGQNDFAGAVREYSQVLKLNPNQSKAWLERGRAYARMRNFLAAQQDFDQAITCGANRVEALIERGNCSLKRRQYDDALREFNEVIKLDETSFEAHLGIARTHFAKREWLDAGRMCNTVLRLDPRNGTAFVIKGGVHYEKKEYDSAILAFSRALESTHDDETICEAYYRRGIARTEAKLQDDAINDLNMLLRRNPGHAGAMFWRANAKARKGEWLGSLDDLQAVIDMNPDYADQYRKFGTLVANKAVEHLRSQDRERLKALSSRRLRGMAFLILGRHPKAIRAFSRCLKMEPNDAMLLIRRGQAHDALGDFDKAVEDFENSVRLDSRNALAFEKLAETHVKADSLRQAVVEYGHAVRLHPEDDRLYIRRGRVHAARGKTERAHDDFMQAIALRPDNHEAYRERGWLYALLGKYKKAIQDFDISIEIFPNQPDLIARRGELHLRRDNCDLAREDFELAVTINPRLVRAYCGRALSMIRTDEHEQALIWLTKSIHRFKTLDEIVEVTSTRARVFFSMSRFNRAVADYTTVIRLLEEGNADPRQAAVSHYARGIAHFHAENIAAAEADWRQSSTLNPERKLGAKQLKWLVERGLNRPAELEPINRVIRPTRPPVVDREATLEPSDEQWNSDPPYDMWILKCDAQQEDDQTEFGPVPKGTLDEWCQEGRIKAAHRLLRADWSSWKKAAVVYPELGPVPAATKSRPASTKPTDDRPSDDKLADDKQADDKSADQPPTDEVSPVDAELSNANPAQVDPSSVPPTIAPPPPLPGAESQSPNDAPNEPPSAL